MKKLASVLLCALIAITMVGASGCTTDDLPSWLKWCSFLPWIDEPTEETPIDCTIEFAKTVNEKYEATELYEAEDDGSYTFTVNTEIYVIVDFTFINYSDNDDVIDFAVHIPYAKYYSTYQYDKGVVVPTEEYRDEVSDDGTVEAKIVLSNMSFVVKSGETPFHYTYVFSIAAAMPCEQAEFRAVFTSEKGYVIERNTTYSKYYTFVEA